MTTFSRADQTCWLLLAFSISREPRIRKVTESVFDGGKMNFRVSFPFEENRARKGRKEIYRENVTVRQTIYGTERILRWGMLFVIYRLCNAKCLLRRSDAERLCVSFGPRCDGTFFNHMLGLHRVGSMEVLDLFSAEIFFVSSLCGGFISGTMLLGGIKVVWESSLE